MQKGGHQGTASHQHGRDCRVVKPKPISKLTPQSICVRLVTRGKTAEEMEIGGRRLPGGRWFPDKQTEAGGGRPPRTRRPG